MGLEKYNTLNEAIGLLDPRPETLKLLFFVCSHIE